jgi:hypothetical protein
MTREQLLALIDDAMKVRGVYYRLTRSGYVVETRPRSSACAYPARGR